MCRKDAQEIGAAYAKVVKAFEDSKRPVPPLVAVVKEDIKTEVNDFLPFLQATKDYFMDQKYALFKGFGKQTLGFRQIMSLIWSGNYSKHSKLGGNMTGEGYILGGVLVVGPGDQGIIYKQAETFNHDWVDGEAILKACTSIQPLA